MKIESKMNKIKIDETFYDFIEMCKIINKKLGYDQRDAGKHFFPEAITFDEWCDLKKYPKKDPEGKYRSSSQIWYEEFNKDILEGKYKQVPYLDFWHFQLKNCVNEGFINDSYGYLNISMDYLNNAEDWQKEIQSVWNKTFKDYADKNGNINIKISY